jgi:hypothetical protein
VNRAPGFPVPLLPLPVLLPLADITTAAATTIEWGAASDLLPHAPDDVRRVPPGATGHPLRSRGGAEQARAASDRPEAADAAEMTTTTTRDLICKI